MDDDIIIREADLGPVIARTDHRDGAIEVNRQVFYKLPPLMQEFVLCHEMVHLRYGVRDEADTNALAAQIFMERAQSPDDADDRQVFLSYLHDTGHDNFDFVGLGLGLFSLGTTVAGIIKNRNAGWYSWSDAERTTNLKAMLANAFEKSRRSKTLPASAFFWQEMQQYTNKDKSLEKFLSRSGNSWVSAYIASYESKYGFGFYDVTPIDWLALPAVRIALAAVIAVGAVLAWRKYRK